MEEGSGMSARTHEKVFLKLQYTDHTWILIKTAKSKKCEYLLLEIREIFIFGMIKIPWKLIFKKDTMAGF